MTHGHDVMDMMAGNSYRDAQELVDAIEAKWGKEERFCTCHTTDMTAAELVAFLEAKGKFMPAGEGFTADPSKRCSHGK